MAAKQNIALAIELALLKQVRAIAARRGCSVSALMADELRDLVSEDRAYEAASNNAKAMLKAGFDLQGARMRDRSEVREGRDAYDTYFQDGGEDRCSRTGRP